MLGSPNKICVEHSWSITAMGSPCPNCEKINQSTLEASMPRNFTEHVLDIVNTIADEDLTQETKLYAVETIKEAVRTYIIGEDNNHEPDVFKPRKNNDNPNAVILNNLRANQRHALGDK